MQSSLSTYISFYQYCWIMIKASKLLLLILSLFLILFGHKKTQQKYGWRFVLHLTVLIQQSLCVSNLEQSSIQNFHCKLSTHLLLRYQIRYCKNPYQKLKYSLVSPYSSKNSERLQNISISSFHICDQVYHKLISRKENLYFSLIY